MEARNFAYLFYGLSVAWLTLALYVVILVQRERRLQRELENLKRMLESRTRERT